MISTIWKNDGATQLSLDGEWQFTLAGKSGAIQVPGSWEASGHANAMILARQGIQVKRKHFWRLRKSLLAFLSSPLLDVFTFGRSGQLAVLLLFGRRG